MKKYYSLVENEDSTVDLYIFGDIVDGFDTGFDEYCQFDSGDVSSNSLVKSLNQLPSDTKQINVHINSFGGYTNEGIAIFNTLKNSKSKVVTYCDGFACSAASLVFMAGDERIMGNGSMLMIHNAWNQAIGNAEELRQQADELDKISKSASECYLDKVSISEKELQTLLDGTNHNGTWISASEAVDMGFATKISKSDDTSSVANQSVKQLLSNMIVAFNKHDQSQIDAKSFAKEIYRLLSQNDDKSDDTDDKKDDTDDTSDGSKKTDEEDNKDDEKEEKDSQSKEIGWFF